MTAWHLRGILSPKLVSRAGFLDDPEEVILVITGPIPKALVEDAPEVYNRVKVRTLSRSPVQALNITSDIVSIDSSSVFWVVVLLEHVIVIRVEFLTAGLDDILEDSFLSSFESISNNFGRNECFFIDQ
jgi:hypothetical protein